MKYTQVLFDLDGTLADSKDGIVNSTLWAFKNIGLSEPNPDEIEIGPPILGTIKRLLGTEQKHRYDDAVRAYRKRYDEVGVVEARLYEGISEALNEIHSFAECHVATSKPTVYALKMLRNLGIAGFFKSVHGSELSGERSNKVELVAHVLSTEKLDTRTTVMVGDRKHDADGALKNGIGIMGAGWGYGTPEELANAGASIICMRPSHLIQLLRS